MRAHGVPDYPDPDATGAVTIKAGPSNSDLNPNSAAFQAAKQACQSLEAAKGHRPQGFKQNLLAYAACMRSHGLPDFPDPVFQKDGVEIDLPSDINENSPLFQAADQACRPLKTGGSATPTAGPGSGSGSTAGSAG
jgi:hypothetical protein